MSDAEFAQALKAVVAGKRLSVEESNKAFRAIMSGEIGGAAIAGLLTALAVRNPTVDEIVGGARAMREAMTRVEAPADAIDLCGTGGDGVGTLNISTACAFVVAGAGVSVAKHGNRNMSSKSGAADVLEALGANLDVDPAAAARCLRENKVCFLFAQRFNPAMKHAGPVRRALGFRTIFNLLGPLSSPAGVSRQLVGVFAREWVEPIAEALRQLGAKSAWVVHGGDGLDELTTTHETFVAVLENGTVKSRTVTPEDAGLPRGNLNDLLGGTAAENAGAIKGLLSGEKGPYRDIVLLNSAAALIVAGKASDLKQGVTMAAASIDGGHAHAALDRYVAESRRTAS